jgi:thioredoxin-related protein
MPPSANPAQPAPAAPSSGGFSTYIPDVAPSEGSSTHIPSPPPPARGSTAHNPAPAPSAGFSTHVPSLRNTFPNPEHPEPAHQGPTGTAKTIFIVLLVLAAIGIYRKWGGPSSSMAAWQSNWEKAVDESQEKKKPIMVLFTADWCPACNQFKDKVLSRNDITEKLKENFVLAKMDLTKQNGPSSAVAQEFGVRVIPTLVIVGTDGTRSDYLTGSVTAEYLEQWSSSRKSIKKK